MLKTVHLVAVGICKKKIYIHIYISLNLNHILSISKLFFKYKYREVSQKKPYQRLKKQLVLPTYHLAEKIKVNLFNNKTIKKIIGDSLRFFLFLFKSPLK